MHSWYYDREGNPITAEEMERLWTPAYKRVAWTDLPGDVHISTVWLGVNHQWMDGAPLIFETMVFGGPLDQEQWRYSTEAQALAGHQEVVTLAELAADLVGLSQEAEEE